MRRVAPLLFLATAACTVATPQADIITAEPESEPVAKSPAVDGSRLPGLPPPPLMAAELEGQFEQGGWIRGVAPSGAISATLDGEPLALDPGDRAFLVGIDRDASRAMEIVFADAMGQTRSQSVAIKPRAWNIERVNVALRPSTSSEAFLARRRPELAAIWDARQEETGAQGWRQDFAWPVTGRISGRFGSQRIYRGEPGSYHTGLDISTGGAGTTYVAPAEGVVVLAEPDFSLEGQLLIIDHGMGLNSAFLHSSELFVRKGDRVTKGQPLGRIGSSGRATGPHLHWSLTWRNQRLDPLLFLPPMP